VCCIFHLIYVQKKNKEIKNETEHALSGAARLRDLKNKHINIGAGKTKNFNQKTESKEELRGYKKEEEHQLTLSLAICLSNDK